ncbi:MAG: metallophosphoesterase [Candidatus Nanopelagicales bacterium]
MRVHIVSDVHGRAAELSDIGNGADVVVCLGDLLLYLDYEDPTKGAFAEIFGPEVTAENIRLRLAKRFDEARELVTDAWFKRVERTGEDDRFALIEQIADRQYAEIFEALPDDAVFTFGNVDLPHVAQKHIKPGQRFFDAEVVELVGKRFGFVSGGLVSPYRTPNEAPVEDFDRRVQQVVRQAQELGGLDVLCAHIPPSIPEITFDVVAKRFEVGSKSLVAAIEELQPTFNVFGHVHQPMYPRYQLGRTQCLNVGHFRSRRTPFVLDL